jgi:hypothetical protein
MIEFRGYTVKISEKNQDNNYLVVLTSIGFGNKIEFTLKGTYTDAVTAAKEKVISLHEVKRLTANLPLAKNRYFGFFGF